MIDITLKPGIWLYANCADMPSDMNCQMVMMAPRDQRKDFMEAAVAHAVKTHGHEDTEDLRSGLEKMIQEIEVK